MAYAAWAIAMTGQNETSGVVWTAETAEAFNICRPVLMSNSAISGRKAFLAAYTRLVAEARTAYRPIDVIASIRSDKHHRAAVIERAVDSGLLPAAAAAPLLAGPASEQTSGVEARSWPRFGKCKQMEPQQRSRLDVRRSSTNGWHTRIQSVDERASAAILEPDEGMIANAGLTACCA